MNEEQIITTFKFCPLCQMEEEKMTGGRTIAKMMYLSRECEKCQGNLAAVVTEHGIASRHGI